MTRSASFTVLLAWSHVAPQWPRATAIVGTRCCRNPPISVSPENTRVTCRACVTRLPCHSKRPHVTRRIHPRRFACHTPRSRNPRPPNPTTHESTRVTRQINQTCHESNVSTHVSRPNGSVFHPHRHTIVARHGWPCPMRTASDTRVGPLSERPLACRLPS